MLFRTNLQQLRLSQLPPISVQKNHTSINFYHTAGRHIHDDRIFHTWD